MNSAARDVISIDRRFCGPPESGNGGYVAGRLAALLEPGAVEVRLHLPPPLGTPLLARMAADGLAEGRIDLLTADGLRVASARPATAPLPLVPLAPTLEEAAAASCRLRPEAIPEYRRCFVCGPQRARGDGMHLYAGPRDSLPGVAVAWTPDASLARDGRIGSEFVWAALDCPGYFACREDGAPMLLGQMTAHIHELPLLGASYVISGWPISRSGRKFESGTALHAPDGRVLAVAHQIWIERKAAD